MNHLAMAQQGQMIGNGKSAGQQFGVEAATPRPEVLYEMDRLQAAIEALETRVYHLDDRLSHVALPRGPEKLGSGNQVAESMAGSVFGQSVQNMRHRVDSLIARIEDVTAHLAI